MKEGPPTCDVLILVTTTSEVEALEKVCAELSLPCRPKEWESLGAYFDLGTIGADRVLAVRTRMGAHGHEGSAYKAILFRLVSQATALIQTGMAFGVNPTSQRVGDVLVAKVVIPYDHRDVLTRDGQQVIDYSRARRRSGKRSLIALFEREIARGGHDFKVHVGALLSGGTRIFHGPFRDELVTSVPPGNDPIVGGEMEGVGLLAVTKADAPIWGIVKGISDFADGDRDGIIEKSRPIACENAVRFVLSSLLHNLPI